MKYNTILWDVDNTLLDFSKSEYESISKSFIEHGLYINDEIVSRYSAINDAFWKRHERGEINKQQVIYGRFEQLFGELGITNIDIPQFQRSYENNLGHIWFYMEDSYELVKKIKAAGLRQYIVTNGTKPVQSSKLSLSGFDKLIDDVFISDEIGIQKPAREYFDAVFEKLGITDRSTTILIGDSLTSDITGAKNAGIESVWYRKEGTKNLSEVVPTYEISSLNEVLSILEIA